MMDIFIYFILLAVSIIAFIIIDKKKEKQRNEYTLKHFNRIFTRKELYEAELHKDCESVLFLEDEKQFNLELKKSQKKGGE